MRQPLLALLAKEPAHGYELKLALEQTFGAAYPSPNIGQIYVTLKRLEADGLVRSQDVEQTTRPNKRVYELTPAGRDAVAAWVEEPSDGPRIRDEFFAKLILAPRAGLADQMELINKQRHHYYRLMRGLNDLQDTASRQDTAARLMVEGTRLHLQADLDWLERCQEELGDRVCAGPAPAPVMLRTRKLVKEYRADGLCVEALRGVDIELAFGEFVAVMGPSGSGKSTLLHVIGGLAAATSGEVWLRGQRVDALSKRDWAIQRRRHIGYVFQTANLLSTMTVADNVELPAILSGVSARQARQRREELLDDLGLTDKARVAPARLSGGEQQRVALARALAHHPSLLLADEPTGNLDSGNTRDVLRLLRRTHAEGQAILLVTHDARVASNADRVINLYDGMVADDWSFG